VYTITCWCLWLKQSWLRITAASKPPDCYGFREVTFQARPTFEEPTPV
jgi:hypothetical protein